MSKVSDDFVRFLKINFPDDYRKVTVDDVKDDVVNSILLKYEKKYRIWLSIPEWIKNEYRDDLPDDVLNGNTTVREFINEEEEKKLDREQENEKLGSFGLSLVALGYTVECAKTLAENREKRRALMCKGCALTDEEKEIIRQTREVDKEAILRDWKGNQNEKQHSLLYRLGGAVRRLRRLKLYSGACRRPEGPDADAVAGFFCAAGHSAVPGCDAEGQKNLPLRRRRQRRFPGADPCDAAHQLPVL